MSDLQELLTPEVTSIAVALLVALSIGGVLYALLQPSISGNERREQRLREVASSSPGHQIERLKLRDADKRRRNVQDQLKEFEERQKSKQKKANRIGLEIRLRQAGLTWSRNGFWIISLIVGLVMTLAGFLTTKSPILIAGFGFVGFLGLPRWYVSFKRKRRFNAFLDELPNAVDVIVRGTKSGLPLGECIQVVARESRDPVATEFRRIVETQALGMSLAEAVGKLPERMPVAEANFFAIVVGIQQQSGGALSEALGNLSKVLRGRKMMKGKIQAMSAEAKASALIIGSLPFAVMGILSLTSPEYIATLFTHPTGNFILLCGGIWMCMGIFVMKKMISFDF
ncbi:type II secretion system F family protein [Stappia sp. F7233]|uniref:Type II secretion system F family protein n=1 Tax=Stappia albiluteola TaxID=2758565 RepID=A0A839AB07_9HYPH|nr:type II secretion system F family protein [Stappia albiluteola]MBA5776228.1 type II secretion system F family protein [Stappia albiluteola]